LKKEKNASESKQNG